MALLQLRNLSLSFGTHHLLDRVDLKIDKGERLCLIGRNGTGKSTLMKLIAGEIQPDDGHIERVQGLKTARLIQEVPEGTDGTIFHVVAEGLGELGALLEAYTEASLNFDADNPAALTRLTDLQHQLDSKGAWELNQRVETILSRLELDSQTEFASLSGGMKRRVLLAQALVQEPDILLLDEPTNHLDIEAINWLETFLSQYRATLVFITHDRAFLRKLATRIIELDRGQLTSWPGSYDKYLTGKQAALEAEAHAQSEFDKKLAQEEAWIRQGIKARRTRNEGRVRALKKLREEHSARRSHMGTVKMNMQAAESSGKIVIEADNISYAYPGEGDTGKQILNDFSTVIFRGDKIGVIGPNGCGKSTLLNLLLGKLQPDQGNVKLGTKLEIAYFDQLRDTLDENKSVADNVNDGRDQVLFNGEPLHILSYLQNFLFEPARARQPVKALSGGERNRLLLAKLFCQPFNMLVLDEPTNDLDSETLDLLEEQLSNFEGTLLLVSHDREFIDNVVTDTLVFEHGQLNGYVGGYQDWLRQRPEPAASSSPATTEPAPMAKQPTQAVAKSAKKLSYKDQRELDQLPELIDQLETGINTLQQAMADPDFYKSDPDVMADKQKQLAELEQQLSHAFERWEILEN